MFSSKELAPEKTTSFSQTKSELGDAAKHVGDLTAPVRLDLGAAFPDQVLAITDFSFYKTDVVIMSTEDNKGNLAKLDSSL